MSVVTDLNDAAVAADPSVVGCAILAANAVVYPEWTVVTRADGLRVRIDSTNGAPSQAAQNAVLSLDLTAAAESSVQTLTRNTFSDPGPIGRLQRAAALVVLDRVNELREWITSFKAAVASATSLANLQTRVANLPNMPDYSADQIKTSIQDKINNIASD